MERKETIRGAYRMTGGNNFYDGMITCSTLSGKAVCRLVWAMNKAECDPPRPYGHHARPVQCGLCVHGAAPRKAGADDYLRGWLPMRLYHLRR